MLTPFYWPLEEREEEAGMAAPTSESQHAVAVVSGGMDSVTLAFLLHAEGWRLTIVSFDYGQRHRRELRCAQSAAGRLGAGHHVIDLTAVGTLLGGSALTDGSVTVPEGHYTDVSMRATVVPNRNAILLAVATGVAVAEGASAVAFRAHAGDHPIYPDCRPAFVEVLAPFIGKTKADIVWLGVQLGVPYAETWSCYVGGEAHCGRCGTCTERREAFMLANVPDPTAYLV